MANVVFPPGIMVVIMQTGGFNTKKHIPSINNLAAHAWSEFKGLKVIIKNQCGENKWHFGFWTPIVAGPLPQYRAILYTFI